MHHLPGGWPTNAYKPEATGKLMLDTNARVNTELGTTVVVITHNAAIALMAGHVLVLGDGHIQRITANAHKLTSAELSW